MNLEKYKKKGIFTLSSGIKSDVYYDLKEAMGEPQNLKEITQEMILRIKEKPEIIIGLDYGGVPIAVSLSLEMNIPYAILRKVKKNHGTENRIEGYQGKGKVLIVDDIRTTGFSVNNAIDYLESIGYDVKQIEVYLTRAEKVIEDSS